MATDGAMPTTSAPELDQHVFQRQRQQIRVFDNQDFLALHAAFPHTPCAGGYSPKASGKRCLILHICYKTGVVLP